MFCHKCGTEIADGAAFCHKCGARMQSTDSVPKEKNLQTIIGQTNHVNVPNAVSSPVDSAQVQSQTAPLNTPKKKSKLPLVFGVAAIAAVIFITVIVVVLKLAGDSASNSAVNLSKVYANEAEGISFQYPSAYDVRDAATYFSDLSDIQASVVLLVNDAGGQGINSIIEVLKFPVDQEAINHLFISDEEFAATFDDDVSIIETSLVEIDGIEVRKIAYVEQDKLYYLSYMYGNGNALYRVNFICSKTLSNSQKRFFDAIMDSYTITAMPTEQEVSDELSGDDKWDMVSVWLHTHGITDYYMCPVSELGNDDFVYDDSDLYFEVSGDYGYCQGIISFNNDDIYITFPVLVDPDNGEWLKTDIYPIEDWYNYIWDGRYDDYGVSSDSTYNNSSMGFSESLEYYSELSGSYEGSTGQSMLSVSIYTSWEETSIGTVGMYVDDEYYYLGEIIAEPGKDVYLVETDTGEEVVLVAHSDYGIIVIDLYVDGQYIDEYWMVEHYES